MPPARDSRRRHVDARMWSGLAELPLSSVRPNLVCHRRGPRVHTRTRPDRRRHAVSCADRICGQPIPRPSRLGPGGRTATGYVRRLVVDAVSTDACPGLAAAGDIGPSTHLHAHELIRGRGASPPSSWLSSGQRDRSDSGVPTRHDDAPTRCHAHPSDDPRPSRRELS